ncbi:MAG: PLP-dependent aminotransferase family protein [Tagaea sp.]|nr:PLP-dependent aminotransferase family protein [Tagaea sp.]
MRKATDETMWHRLYQEFEGRGDTLQGRVKEMLVHAILDGFVSPEARLPSSRTLSRELGLSRVTVTLALQQMLDHGFVVSRPRSGLYVNRDVLTPYLGAGGAGRARTSAIDWSKRLRVAPGAQRNIAKPADWQSFRYPFIYGQFDRSLLPIADWRACAHESLTVKAIQDWSSDRIDRDLDALTEQIQRRCLPSRGIWAARDEILVTVGGQQACYLLADLLMGPRTRVGMEDPGYPDARNNFLLRAGTVVPIPVDRFGLTAGKRLAGLDYVYTTPSHQCPTNVTMPIGRRKALLDAARTRDVVVIEDDHESELNFEGRPLPALKSLDRHGRVIHVGSLSKTMSHGVRIGFVVADAPLIAELRALRRLNLRHPPSNNAYAAALFLAQGHRDSFVARLNAVYRERRAALLAALARHMPRASVAKAAGGSAAWVTLDTPVDGKALVEAAARRGVLVETGDIFFAVPPRKTRHLRLGYSAIPLDRIAPGIAELARAMADAA